MTEVSGCSGNDDDRDDGGGGSDSNDDLSSKTHSIRTDLYTFHVW